MRKSISPQDIVDRLVTDFYLVQKITGERITKDYPIFRFFCIREEIMKDPEFRKQPNTMGSGKHSRFR